MNKRDIVRRKLERPRGILNFKVAEPATGLWRYWPSDALAPFVEHYWIVAWDVPEPRVAETLPHPSVHMVIERGRSTVVGVGTAKFTRVLEGKGGVLGTKFRPGGFRTFLAGPVSTLTDRTLSIEEVFGVSAGELERRVLEYDDHREAIAVVESFLLARRPVRDDDAELAARIAARIETDREITKVEQVAREFGVGVRNLQRLFGEYVGVGPKWVIQRFRLHEAVERMASAAPIDWAELALELGYADQAHLIRDFKKLIGRSPAQYAKALS